MKHQRFWTKFNVVSKLVWWKLPRKSKNVLFKVGTIPEFNSISWDTLYIIILLVQIVYSAILLEGKNQYCKTDIFLASFRISDAENPTRLEISQPSFTTIPHRLPRCTRRPFIIQTSLNTFVRIMVSHWIGSDELPLDRGP